MRKHPEMATEALKAILATGNFAKELVHTLQAMLRFDGSTRASVERLLGDGYIRSCLKLGKETHLCDFYVGVFPSMLERMLS